MKVSFCPRMLFLLLTLAFLSPSCVEKTEKESGPKQGEWIWLFNGESTDAWREVKTQKFPDEGWSTENKVLTVLAKTDHGHGGGDIITKEQFENFELQLEFRLTEGANSGIKYFVVDNINGFKGQFLGCEYQLIDNENHPDALNGVGGNRKLAALYDLIPVQEYPEIKPPGQWNQAAIVVKGNMVTHRLNNLVVLEYNRTSGDFRERVQKSKYSEMKNFGEMDRGHILLQGHGNEVSFRNIKIKKL